MKEPTLDLQVHKIFRADVVAFQVTIRNDTAEEIPAGLKVEVIGSEGKRQWTFTTQSALSPGEVTTESTQGLMEEQDVTMEFTARLVE